MTCLRLRSKQSGLGNIHLPLHPVSFPLGWSHIKGKVTLTPVLPNMRGQPSPAHWFLCRWVYLKGPLYPPGRSNPEVEKSWHFVTWLTCPYFDIIASVAKLLICSLLNWIESKLIVWVFFCCCSSWQILSSFYLVRASSSYFSLIFSQMFFFNSLLIRLCIWQIVIKKVFVKHSGSVL
jgi:hypothetical protein